MMATSFQEWLAGPLGEAGGWSFVLAVVTVAAGVALWLFGAGFSQSLMTLTMVAIGAFVGMRLPRWYAIPLASWATAIGGALALGVLGYLLHRLCVGAALAALLTIWAALAVLLYYSGQVQFPGRAEDVTLLDYCRRLWESFPADLRKTGTLACGVAAISAVGISVLWSRVSAYLFYSLMGVSLLLAAIQIGRPQMFTSLLPAEAATRWAVIGGLVLFGILVQWRMSPGTATAKPADDAESEP